MCLQRVGFFSTSYAILPCVRTSGVLIIGCVGCTGSTAVQSRANTQYCIAVHTSMYSIQNKHVLYDVNGHLLHNEINKPNILYIHGINAFLEQTKY